MACEAAELTSNIRQALQETISELLSADPGARKTAEQQVKALEVTDDYGLHLTELTLSPHGALPLRQMSALLLKQYVDHHWATLSEKFTPPEAPQHVKAAIRRLLPLGLKESISKVRSSVAYTISTIAYWDWPEEWPELFDILMSALHDSSEFAVIGAVRVLKEFSRDLSDTQIPHVAPIVLPDIYRIFMESDAYGIRTRARAIEIFTTFVDIICNMSNVNESLSKSILAPVLPTFTEGLVSALNVPDESHASDIGLKTEVLKALTILVNNVPKYMSPWLAQILPPVWSTLTASATKYVCGIVNENSQSHEEEEVVDSDGEVLHFENLVFAIFEFVRALVDLPESRGAIKSGLADLMYYIVMYMQIPDEQAKRWLENPERYIDDEEDDSFAYSLRVSSRDLLMCLCEEFAEDSCVSLAHTIERHLAESEECKKSGSNNWWKFHEAVMLCLGSCKSVIEAQIQAGNVKFDVAGFLQNVVLPDISNPVSPFLLGRCLWIAGKFATRLPPIVLKSFLESTVMSLQADQIISVRIMAIRGIYEYCHNIRPLSPSIKETSLRPVLPATLESLIDMCSAYNSSSEIVGLVLENLQVILSCDPELTTMYEGKITPMVIAIFLQYSSDPMIMALTQDIFKVLSQTAGCITSLQVRLVPAIVSILNYEEDDQKSGLQVVALDVLQTLVRGSNAPLSDLIMNSAFPAAIQCTLHSNDDAIMQSGGECLRAFVSVSPDQVYNFTDNTDSHKSGLWYLVQVAGHLLNPVGSEFTATFVGRLVTTLIAKTGDRLGSDLDLLLKAVLSKLQGSGTLSVIQSLLMVYAQLIHSQMEAVLNFLSSTPGPKGDTALHFVLTEWVSRQHMFYGDYENKVTIVALSKLLQHGVNSNDSRLKEIIVQGDPLNPTPWARTRSEYKLNPIKWTEIDVLSKIFKLLASQLYDISNYDASRDDCEEEDETDEESQDGANMMEDDSKESTIPRNRYLNREEEYDEEEDDDDDDDDPDALNDPIYKLNLKKYLVEYLTEFSKQPYFDHFFQQTSFKEKLALSMIL